jgi:hypothetical protein
MAQTATFELREIEAAATEAIQKLRLKKLRAQLEKALWHLGFYQTNPFDFCF